MTAHPKPGTVLSAESVKLLLPGDVLRCSLGDSEVVFDRVSTHPGNILIVNWPGYVSWDYFTFVSHPDQSGDATDIVSRPSLEPPASDVAGWRLGDLHTAMMDAIREDILRQHPGAFTEDTDAEIVIPVGAVPVNLYCKIDVSALAEAAMLAAAPPFSEGKGTCWVSNGGDGEHADLVRDA